MTAEVGFSTLGGGGGLIEPPQTEAGGFREKGSFDRTINQLLTLKMVKIFFIKCMANDHFSEPPRRASKNPIFIFCRILVPGHLRGPEVSLSRILGVLSVEPFLGEGTV